MTLDRSTASLLRLTQSEPQDLDAVLAGFDPRHAPSGRDIAPCRTARALPPCPLARPDQVVVATRVRSPLADPCDAAFRLAALSIQHGVDVVVFSDLDYSGLERFGFHTERVAGETDAEKAACLDQLRRFWGVELMV